MKRTGFSVFLTFVLHLAPALANDPLGAGGALPVAPDDLSITPSQIASVGAQEKRCPFHLLPRTLSGWSKTKIRKLNLLDFSRNTYLIEIENFLQVPEANLWLDLRNGKFSSLLRSLQNGKITSWHLSVFPDERVRRLALSYQPAFQQLVGAPDRISLYQISLEQFREYLQVPFAERVSLSEFQQTLDSRMTLIRNRYNGAADMDANGMKTDPVTLLGICAKYGLFSSKACADALKKIINDMHPKLVPIGSMQHAVSMVDLIVKTLSDPIYTEAARRAALKIVDEVASGTLPRTRLWEDLYSSFIESGATETQAYEGTWDLLGLYATRGANIGETLLALGGKESEPFAFAMNTVALGMNILDSRTVARGFHYSLPRGVRSSLDSGKPYHFWLSAYLSRQMFIETGSHDGALNAAWIAQLGYQMRSHSAGRNPAIAFTVEPLDQANNKIRTDLTFAAAGANYGVAAKNALPATRLDLDNGYRALLEGAGTLPPLPIGGATALENEHPIKYFSRWMEIFNPDLLLKIFKM